MRQRNPRQRDEAHLKFIRGLPCLVCRDNTSTEAAHLRRADMRAAKPFTGLSIKPNDCWTIPLCGKCHRHQHEVGEERFWDGAMIDPTFVCMALAINSGDQEAGEQIIEAQH